MKRDQRVETFQTLTQSMSTHMNDRKIFYGLRLTHFRQSELHFVHVVKPVSSTKGKVQY